MDLTDKLHIVRSVFFFNANNIGIQSIGKLAISAYPNPTSGIVNFEFEDTIFRH